VTNKANINKSVNTAIGKGATANMGSITMENTSVKGTVTNQANINKSVNTAIGENSEASMGSVVLE